MRTLRVVFTFSINDNKDRYVDTVYIRSGLLGDKYYNPNKVLMKKLIKNNGIINPKHKINNVEIASFQIYDLDLSQVEFLSKKVFENSILNSHVIQ